MNDRPIPFPESPEGAYGRALRVLDEIEQRDERIFALTVALQDAIPEDARAAHPLLGMLHDLAADVALLGMLRGALDRMRPAAARATVEADAA